MSRWDKGKWGEEDSVADAIKRELDDINGAKGNNWQDALIAEKEPEEHHRQDHQRVAFVGLGDSRAQERAHADPYPQRHSLGDVYQFVLEAWDQHRRGQNEDRGRRNHAQVEGNAVPVHQVGLPFLFPVSASGYGAYAQVGVVVGVIAPLASLGLGTVMVRFFSSAPWTRALARQMLRVGVGIVGCAPVSVNADSAS